MMDWLAQGQLLNTILCGFACGVLVTLAVTRQDRTRPRMVSIARAVLFAAVLLHVAMVLTPAHVAWAAGLLGK